jgi:hypothetical protein
LFERSVRITRTASASDGEREAILSKAERNAQSNPARSAGYESYSIRMHDGSFVSAGVNQKNV